MLSRGNVEGVSGGTAAKPWWESTAGERLERRLAAFTTPQVTFVSAEAAAAYQARASRIKDAILLETTPDRVPVCTLTQFYPAHRVGFTPYEVMYNPDKAAQAWLSYNLELQPDAQVSPASAVVPGPVYDLLDFKLFHWPGHGVPREASFQYNEQEWMSADEYDALIEDPTDYMLHVYVPRTNGRLVGLATFDSPLDMVEMCGAPFWLAQWATPEAQETLARLTEAGRQAAAWAGWTFGLVGRLMAEGYPAAHGLVTWAPFDYLGDTLRGTRGIVTDMYRHPDKLLAACDRMASLLLKVIVRRAAPSVPPLVFIPLHKGADGFMSDEQFRTFYWPSLRKVIMGLIEQGLVPYLFAEGAYNSRLEIIRDVPPGRTVWHFDQTDMRSAKEALGGVACIQGNVPLSLLQLGTPEDVTTYCRRLIRDVADGGGFILDIGAGADTGKEENFRAMFNSARRFGVY